MCTQDEAKQAVIEALKQRDDDGRTFLGKEINAHITAKGNQIISKLTFRIFYASVGIVFAGASTWFALYYQVQANSEAIERNATAINEGGRYTQEEADRDYANIQRQIDEVDRELESLNNKLDIIIQQTR